MELENRKGAAGLWLCLNNYHEWDIYDFPGAGFPFAELYERLHEQDGANFPALYAY